VISADFSDSYLKHQSPSDGCGDVLDS